MPAVGKAPKANPFRRAELRDALTYRMLDGHNTRTGAEKDGGSRSSPLRELSRRIALFQDLKQAGEIVRPEGYFD
jgi:hypothetical protein